MMVSQDLSKEMAFELSCKNEKKPAVQKGSKRTLNIEQDTYKLSQVQKSLHHSRKKLNISVMDKWSPMLLHCGTYALL